MRDFLAELGLGEIALADVDGVKGQLTRACDKRDPSAHEPFFLSFASLIWCSARSIV